MIAFRRSMKRAEVRDSMERLEGDARRIALHFDLTYRSLEPERANVKSRYGVCYSEGSICIRLRQAKRGRPPLPPPVEAVSESRDWLTLDAVMAPSTSDITGAAEAILMIQTDDPDDSDDPSHPDDGSDDDSGRNARSRRLLPRAPGRTLPACWGRRSPVRRSRRTRWTCRASRVAGLPP